MAKTHTPLFSFGSSGSLRNTLTTQKRGKETLIRAKPTPSDPRSLGQTYQRWLYEDYIEQWHALSEVQQAQWETNARPHHMTGFAFFMKDRLTNLPDIAAYWKLDTISGGLFQDSSRNLTPATPFGAILAPGFIDHAASLDGIDDYLRIDPVASLDFGAGDFTFELLCSFTGWSPLGFDTFISQDAPPHAIQLDYKNTTNELRIILYVAAVAQVMAWAWTPALDTIYHLAFRRSSGQNLIFVDGSPLGAAKPSGVDIDLPTSFWTIGRHVTRYLEAIVDQFIVYNRALADATILRHSLRRYPL